MERFWPHKVDGEGHFVAKLVRRGSVNELGADYDVCEDSCNKVEDTGLKADRKTKKNKNSKNRKNETKTALTKENMKLLSEFLDETISEDMAAWIKTQGLSCLVSSSTDCLIWKWILRVLRCSEQGFI